MLRQRGPMVTAPRIVLDLSLLDFSVDQPMTQDYATVFRWRGQFFCLPEFPLPTRFPVLPRSAGRQSAQCPICLRLASRGFRAAWLASHHFGDFLFFFEQCVEDNAWIVWPSLREWQGSYLHCLASFIRVFLPPTPHFIFLRQRAIFLLSGEPPAIPWRSTQHLVLLCCNN